MLEIEQRANRYIWENHAIEITWPTREELAHIPYRSKKALEGPVRLTGFRARICAPAAARTSCAAARSGW